MQIIKENKGNYEIYDLIEFDEYAKKFREENAKSLEFYRLTIDTWNYQGILMQILADQEKEEKKVYGFRKLPINENKFYFGDTFQKNGPMPYELSEYMYDISKFDSRSKIIGLKQQKDFIEQFIEEGLSGYTFKQSPFFSNPFWSYDDEYYIFLNSWSEKSNTRYSGTENVVHLPYEIIAQYLIEQSHLDAGFCFNKIKNKHLQRKLINTFGAHLSSTISPQCLVDLNHSQLLNEEEFVRRKILNVPIANLINKKR